MDVYQLWCMTSLNYDHEYCDSLPRRTKRNEGKSSNGGGGGGGDSTGEFTSSPMKTLYTTTTHRLESWQFVICNERNGWMDGGRERERERRRPPVPSPFLRIRDALVQQPPPPSSPDITELGTISARNRAPSIILLEVFSSLLQEMKACAIQRLHFV